MFPKKIILLLCLCFPLVIMAQSGKKASEKRGNQEHVRQERKERENDGDGEKTKKERQEVYRGPFLTNKPFDNTFVYISGGLSSSFIRGIYPRINAAFDVGGGKWYVPSIGIRIGLQGYALTYASDHPSLLSPYPLRDCKRGNFSRLWYVYLHGDLMWNVFNTFGGYKNKRTWNMSPYVHFGLFAYNGLDGIDEREGKSFYYTNNLGYRHIVSERTTNNLACGIGIYNTFRVSDMFSFVLDLRGIVTPAHPILNNDNATFLTSAFFGFQCALGKRIKKDWDRAVSKEVAVSSQETSYQDLLKRINEDEVFKRLQQIQNESCPVCPENIDSIIERPLPLYFEIGKSKLTSLELQHLELYVQSVVQYSDPSSIFYLTGSADIITGSRERNMTLGQERVEYVKNILIDKYHIPRDRIRISPTNLDNQHSIPELNRVVIIQKK